jgi:hypothetical protein
MYIDTKNMFWTHFKIYFYVKTVCFYSISGSLMVSFLKAVSLVMEASYLKVFVQKDYTKIETFCYDFTRPRQTLGYNNNDTSSYSIGECSFNLQPLQLISFYLHQI